MLELIIMLPVWIIALLAVIEFGLLVANRQTVALASRVGAEEASRTVGLAGTSDGDPVPQNVMFAIQQQLESSGITQCKVLLQHSLVAGPPLPAAPVELRVQQCVVPNPPPPTPPIDLESGTCDFSVGPPVCTAPGCDCPGPDESNLPIVGDYVRVTVYVPLTQLTPNLLAACGLDLSGRFVSNTTTFRHEL